MSEKGKGNRTGENIYINGERVGEQIFIPDNNQPIIINGVVVGHKIEPAPVYDISDMD